MPANFASTDAATPPQPSTKGRCGPVQTVSNNTSALTKGDLARARAAKAQETTSVTPPAAAMKCTSDPRALRNGVNHIIQISATYQDSAHV